MLDVQKRVKCACADPNATLCHRIRYNIIPEQYGTEEDDACSCICHQQQEFDDEEDL
jgi:hypothetical protein